MDDDLLDEGKETELDPDALPDPDAGAGLDDDLGDETPKADEVEEEAEESPWGSE